ISSELSKIRIEISALSELKKIDNYNEIEVGKHGILIQKGFYSGLLLPQVATEYGWTRDEFISHTCRKAGLPMDAWKKEDLDVYVFTADIFCEQKES
ncbi:AMMECR1 family protein, partial [bacterium]|nr:AMMECR1 family protein [bacterium]